MEASEALSRAFTAALLAFWIEIKTSLFEMPGSGAIEKFVMTKLYFWRIRFFYEVEYRTFETFYMDFDP